MFSKPVRLLSRAVIKNCFILGDFNLDARMELRNDYIYRDPFSLLSNFIVEKNLVQLVNFETWTRTNILFALEISYEIVALFTENYPSLMMFNKLLIQ